MPAAGASWSALPDGIRLRVRLVPKSSSDAVVGLEMLPDGPAIKARVRAVPEDGKANAAVTSLIANWIGIAKSKVGLVGGQKSRTKTLHIEGWPDDLGRRVDALIAAIADAAGQGKVK